MWDWIKSIFWDVFEEMAAELLGLGITLALFLAAFLVLGVPVYVVLKKLGFRVSPGGPMAFKQFQAAAQASEPPLDPQTVERLDQLDAVENSVSSFYRYFLYVVLALGTGLAIFFFWKIRTDASRDFLYFYFGIAYLVFLGWVGGQLYSLKSRDSRRRRRQTVMAGSRPKPSSFQFTFQVGRNPMAESGPVSAKLDPHAGSQAPPGMTTSQLVALGVILSILMTAGICALIFWRVNGV
jgi:hypothetical protein